MGGGKVKISHAHYPGQHGGIGVVSEPTRATHMPNVITDKVERVTAGRPCDDCPVEYVCMGSPGAGDECKAFKRWTAKR